MRQVVLLATALVIGASAAMLSSVQTDAVAHHYHDRQGNYCIGGLQDRKVIPYDLIRRPMKETSVFGCEVGGGRAVYMPDLEPAIKDGILA